MADELTPYAAVVETHVSVVFFVGSRAYKLRKPVNPGFVDWRTREAREAAAHREVELNRRFAPDVYLGVADVLAPDGLPMDHLVVMRRMPEERRLTRLLDGAGAEQAVRAVARELAGIHAAAPRSPAIDADAGVNALLGNWEKNLAVVRDAGRGLVDEDAAREVEGLARQYLEGRRALVDERIKRGLVVDGHGDLQADDIFILDDGPRLLDCLDFDERLRHLDVLNDAAFLAMDLERLGNAGLAASFLSAYSEYSGEHHPPSLAHYYIAYRAHVRALVAAVRWSQGEGSSAEAFHARHQLCLEHLDRSIPRMVLVGGVPGSGKSTVARGVADALAMVLVSSDAVRREVTGDVTDRYSSAEKDHVYRTVLERAESALGMGESVVLDATWSDPRWRRWAEESARRTASRLVQLQCVVSPGIAAARAETRSRRGMDVSEAGAAESQLVRADFAAWPEAARIETASPPAAALAAAIRHLGVRA